MSIDIKKQLAQKRIAILGLGIENQALLKYLLKQKIKNPITICDARSVKELGGRYIDLKDYKQIKRRLQKKFNQKLYDFDLLFRSPGWPILCPGIQEALKHEAELNSAMNLFLTLCPTKNIIGVSGTKGKGTAASLINQILKTAGKKVWLGGNIGIAPFAFLAKIKPADWVVLELSSFQLEDLKSSPKYSVITNIYKEHLAPADPLNPNYHKSYRSYILAKLNLLRYQTKTDYSFLNKKFQKLFSQYKKYLGPGQKIYYNSSKLTSRLVGNYNQENIGAAVALAKTLKISNAIIKKSIATFVGLEHRLEFVTKKNNITYYDNSFATTPESTIMDLQSFKEPIILLVGGADKGANFKPLAQVIKKKVKFTLLLQGAGTKRIRNELVKIKYGAKNMVLVSSMDEAINQAKKLAQPNDIVLLSTACASFGMFKNYKERGNQFKHYVQQ
ncbi:UDP-N-acetylmuramoylalanine--D-glutamate ligase [Candidatus Falkowbacteria bacterium CG1_02_41_21]|uniref:UDP-N-acetylmuramoylalanine--D-glutamate ligase n=1 Tax=Candidatus Falkowbacteria bacterium CG1_02_41_21 TaxID=1805147 RepID=A0A1J4T4U2_9BACT|nr:MAG: UDP-N-acetylmuramoylalanine--D-glutamate ligase [Candidatus Falkowbacteria bacterium CG1_02_41_21]